MRAVSGGRREPNLIMIYGKQNNKQVNPALAAAGGPLAAIK